FLGHTCRSLNFPSFSPGSWESWDEGDVTPVPRNFYALKFPAKNSAPGAPRNDDRQLPRPIASPVLDTSAIYHQLLKNTRVALVVVATPAWTPFSPSNSSGER